MLIIVDVYSCQYHSNHNDLYENLLVYKLYINPLAGEYPVRDTQIAYTETLIIAIPFKLLTCDKFQHVRKRLLFTV